MGNGEFVMSKKWTNWNGDVFPLTDEEYNFIKKHDLWEALGEVGHQWDIDNDPGAWDLMMETFIPAFKFMENGA